MVAGEAAQLGAVVHGDAAAGEAAQLGAVVHGDAAAGDGVVFFDGFRGRRSDIRHFDFVHAAEEEIAHFQRLFRFHIF